MSGRIPKRDFKELEVGKTYLADYSRVKVTIIEMGRGCYLGDNGIYYTKTGKVKESKWNTGGQEYEVWRCSGEWYHDLCANLSDRKI